jgi:hypothetical protein
MKKYLSLIGCLVLVLSIFACATTDTAKFEDSMYKSVKSDFEDYQSWNATHDEPMTGDMTGALGPAHAGEEGWRMVYANKIAEKTMKSGNYPFSAGAIIVKESYPDAGGEPGELANLTIMVKRGSGYDPDNGNWEYLMTSPDMMVAEMEGNKVQGKIGMCIGCHAEAEDMDYVFSTFGM